MKTVVNIIQLIGYFILTLLGVLIIIPIWRKIFPNTYTTEEATTEAKQKGWPQGTIDALKNSAEQIALAFGTSKEYIDYSPQTWTENEEKALTEIRKWNEKLFIPDLSNFYKSYTDQRNLGSDFRRYLSKEDWETIQHLF